MKIYIEYVLLQNIIINYFLIYLSILSIKIIPNKWRIFFSAFLGALGSIIYPYVINVYIINMYKVALAFVMVWMAVGKAKTKNILFAMLALCVYTYCFGGLIYALGGQSILSGYLISSRIMWSICGAIVAFFVVMKMFTKRQYKWHKAKQYVYEITLFNDNRHFSTTAYLDTGNNLMDNDHTPITIITPAVLVNICDISLAQLFKKDLTNTTLKHVHFLNYGTVSSNGKMLVFKIDKISIKNQNTSYTYSNASCGLVYKQMHKYNVLLNYQQAMR